MLADLRETVSEIKRGGDEGRNLSHKGTDRAGGGHDVATAPGHVSRRRLTGREVRRLRQGRRKRLQRRRRKGTVQRRGCWRKSWCHNSNCCTGKSVQPQQQSVGWINTFWRHGPETRGSSWRGPDHQHAARRSKRSFSRRYSRTR